MYDKYAYDYRRILQYVTLFLLKTVSSLKDIGNFINKNYIIHSFHERIHPLSSPTQKNNGLARDFQAKPFH